jgi:hypothetical protein
VKDQLHEAVEFLRAKGTRDCEIIDIICVGLYGKNWWTERMKIRKILRMGAIYHQWMKLPKPLNS